MSGSSAPHLVCHLAPPFRGHLFRSRHVPLHRALKDGGEHCESNGRLASPTYSLVSKPRSLPPPSSSGSALCEDLGEDRRRLRSKLNWYLSCHGTAVAANSHFEVPSTKCTPRVTGRSLCRRAALLTGDRLQPTAILWAPPPGRPCGPGGHGAARPFPAGCAPR